MSTDRQSPFRWPRDDQNLRLASLRADATRSRELASKSTGDFRDRLLGLASDIEHHVVDLETAWRKWSHFT
jgi:hypothetical protein